MCGHNMPNFSEDPKDSDPDSSKDGKHEGPMASLSTEKAFEDLNNNSIINHQDADSNLEDAIRKARENFAALASIKDTRAFTPLK